jgi:hypothetical protein
MTTNWNNRTRDVVMSGNKEELERRIKDNEKRGMVLVHEPTLISNVYVNHNISYSTWHKKPKFHGKEFDIQLKWMCKMRKVDVIT